MIIEHHGGAAYTKTAGAPLHPGATVMLAHGMHTLPETFGQRWHHGQIIRSWAIPASGIVITLDEFLEVEQVAA